MDTYLAQIALRRRVEFTVESFLLAPTVLEGTDLVAFVLERAVPLLQRTAAIRLLEPPAASTDHPDAVVEPAPHHGPGTRVGPGENQRDRRRTGCS
ncbi:hypothetical protein ACFQ0G_47960 [Streptomyces chiangmaiensis]